MKKSFVCVSVLVIAACGNPPPTGVGGTGGTAGVGGTAGQGGNPYCDGSPSPFQILQTKCTSCHANPPRNNAPADTNFTDLNVVRAKALRIAARVSGGTMPPPGTSVVPSSQERQILADWANQGAPGRECGGGGRHDGAFCQLPQNIGECCRTDPSWRQGPEHLPCAPDVKVGAFARGDRRRAYPVAGNTRGAYN